MSSATRLIIADDHPIVRAGVRMLASSRPDFDLVAETSTAEETLQKVAELGPDVLVLDLWLGEDDGLDLLRTLRRERSEVKVLIYSMNDEELYGPRTIQAGARGYLMKDQGLDELARAIEIVVSGKRYLAANLLDRMIDGSMNEPPPRNPAEPVPLRTLTDRELHILRLVGRGLGTGEVARTLGISPKTVGAHRENLKQKLGVGTAQELVRLAVTYVEQRAI